MKKCINGKSYQFAGEYPYKPAFIDDYRRIMEKHGFIVKIKYFKNLNKIEIWSRKR